MIVCLDFDGVLHDSQHPLRGRKMGPPMPGALEAVAEMRRRGYRLVIHTSRVAVERQAQHVYDWLKFYGFPMIPVKVEKPPADVYVDDKGYQFEGWHAAVDWIAYYEPRS